MDVDAAAAWLENEDPASTGESGAREMKRIAGQALDVIRERDKTIESMERVTQAVIDDISERPDRGEEYRET